MWHGDTGRCVRLGKSLGYGGDVGRGVSGCGMEYVGDTIPSHVPELMVCSRAHS
jgi:hypothetical protein